MIIIYLTRAGYLFYFILNFFFSFNKFKIKFFFFFLYNYLLKKNLKFILEFQIYFRISKL